MLYLVNLLIIIFIILIFYQTFLENKNIEGYMAVIGPVITPKEKIVSSSKNTYYENNNIKQDFDPYSVLQDYDRNSVIIQEDPEYVLTTNS